MFQNREVRNECKQQLKDKINKVQNSNNGYKPKWKNVCTTIKEVAKNYWI